MLRRSQLPEQLKLLLALIQGGRIFEVQSWVADGKKLRFHEVEDPRVCPLRVAVETGFHSMVEVLVQAGGWTADELSEAAELAFDLRRLDVAELLLSGGAKLNHISFYIICKTVDLGLMERFLRAGGDPSRNNDFASALSYIKARPLLRFYRSFHEEFPALDDQAALALHRAVQKEEVRWTALLAWAGADPFRPVPYNDDETFPVDPENSTNAAHAGIWAKNPDILKVLKLKPSAAQAVELLDTAAYNSKVELFRMLVKRLTPEQLNTSPRGSCEPLESLVRRSPHWDYWAHVQKTEGEAESLQCIELLLDIGAKWNPPPDSLRSIRRSILEHNGRYIVLLIRLLLYTPNSANIQSVLELCRSNTLMAKIAEADRPLVGDINDLRKKHRTLNVSDGATKTETAPAVAMPGDERS